MKFDVNVIEYQHRRVEAGIDYLEKLFDSEEWPTISEDHRFLLVAQHSAMNMLEMIFRRRIELLSEEAEDALEDEFDVMDTVNSLVGFINKRLNEIGDSGVAVRVVRVH